MMRIRFYADSSVNANGFIVHYTPTDRLCGGVFAIGDDDGPVNISSPGYPSTPDQNPTNCRWSLGAPSGKQIRLTINDLLISGDSDCSTNFLHLRDKSSFVSEGPAQDLQICNISTPFIFDSYGDELTYELANCNRTYSALDGRVVSPGWPNRYPHNMNCVITIAIPDPKKRIAMYFNQFDIEDHNSCRYDYIEVFDGSLSNSIGKHCGAVIPDPIVSNTSTILIQVKSDSSINLGGFEMTYVASNSGCGGTLTATSGTFSSPPPGISNCVWVLDLPTRRRPTIQFPVMDLRQNSTACAGAHVEIRDGGIRLLLMEDIAM
ncbi:hypothetical protein EB796_022837 [Bugula neritina]|uniref:CUB domain-containing protein n=1 Tax=Bugula neritina TaxID=10212 RepID=A0A7J7J059_BUGNE|nr:hypothetical protein EB796_022837 [Bugula neritina]